MVQHARLVEQTALNQAGREVAIQQPEFLIGRALGCDLRLSVSAVSRHHCLLTIDGDRVLLVDLNSSNGTHVNGHPVIGRVELHPGDRIRIGTSSFIVHMNRSDTLILGDEDTPNPD